MPAYSFKKAKECGAVNEKDVERLACLFLLICGQATIGKEGWKKAGVELDMKPHSIECAMSTLYKKLRERNCTVDQDDGGTAAAKSIPSKKRKVGDDGEGKGFPAKKAAPARKKTNSIAVKREQEDEGSVSSNIEEGD